MTTYKITAIGADGSVWKTTTEATAPEEAIEHFAEALSGAQWLVMRSPSNLEWAIRADTIIRYSIQQTQPNETTHSLPEKIEA